MAPPGGRSRNRGNRNPGRPDWAIREDDRVPLCTGPHSKICDDTPTRRVSTRSRQRTTGYSTEINTVVFTDDATVDVTSPYETTSAASINVPEIRTAAVCQDCVTVNELTTKPANETSPLLSVPILAGSAGAGALIILLVITVAVLVCKLRRKAKPSKTRVASAITRADPENEYAEISPAPSNNSSIRTNITNMQDDAVIVSNAIAPLGHVTASEDAARQIGIEAAGEGFTTPTPYSTLGANRSPHLYEKIRHKTVNGVEIPYTSSDSTYFILDKSSSQESCTQTIVNAASNDLNIIQDRVSTFKPNITPRGTKNHVTGADRLRIPEVNEQTITKSCDTIKIVGQEMENSGYFIVEKQPDSEVI